MSVLLPLVPLLPLLVAAALLVRPLRGTALALAPWAPLPALGLAIAAGEPEAFYSWLLLGTELGLDATGRGFLLAAAAVWLGAGAYARSYHRDDPRRVRLWAFFLLSLSGNLVLVLAADAVTFYLGFALMTFAAYGLVVHDGTARAVTAGRYYLGLALGAEAVLLGALLVAVQAAETRSFATLPAELAGDPLAPVAATLVLVGFAVKAGVLPVHVWLPLAHPVAPTPASAVLSGAMIKAGLLGWLRFLPLGEQALPALGAGCVVLGFATAFYGVAIGVGQDELKTNLAYSSVSQMGLALVAVGAALVRPEAWPLAAAAATFQAVQHGLAKGALFLGAGVVAGAAGRRARRAALAGLAVCALALAGAPLTSGALAKSALERPLGELAWDWPAVLLPFAAAGTALLLGRALVLARRDALRSAVRAPRGLWVPWALLVAAALTAAWSVPVTLALPELPPYRPTLGGTLAAAWPVAAGVALLAAATLAPRLRRLAPRVAPGDIGPPAARLLAMSVAGLGRALAAAARTGRGAAGALGRTLAERRPGDVVAAAESRLSALAAAGTLLLAVGLLLVALLALGDLP